MFVEILEQNNISVMTSEEAFGGIILSVTKDDILKTIQLLKAEKYDMFISVGAVDCGENFELVYNLYSTSLSKKIIVKTSVSRQRPELQSVSSLYSTANWHERECFDLMGVSFLNHPDLKRILMPADWIGHPLRKDYKLEDERLSWNKR